MIRYFTNREIAAKLDINLARWKRWSRSFLEPDPLGGMQSGYARQYVFKDLFKVFLGGHLLSHLKLSVPESRQVLTDLSPWLKEAGFLELNGSTETLLIQGRQTPYRIYFRPLASVDQRTGFGYLIRRTVGTWKASAATGPQVVQRIDELLLNCDVPDGRTFLRHPQVRMINLSALTDQLIEGLQNRCDGPTR